MLGWRFDGIPPRLWGGPWAWIFRRRWFRRYYHPSPECVRDIAVKCRNRSNYIGWVMQWDTPRRKQP